MRGITFWNRPRVSVGASVARVAGVPANGEPNNYLTLENIGGNGVIMRTKILLISCLLVFVLGCNLLPTGEAVTFNIGERGSKSDFIYTWYNYTSGALLRIGSITDEKMYDNITYILDGNTSTGLDLNISLGNHAIMLFFPFPLFVNNITVLPAFGGNASSYRVRALIGWNDPVLMPDLTNKTNFYNINTRLNGLEINILSVGPSHTYFNDVIINYTINLTDLSSVNNAINILQNSINSLQNQFNNLANQFDEINDLIIELNNSITNINQTQKQILDNITNLWSFYHQLNESLSILFDEFDNLNFFAKQNISNLWTNFDQLNNSIKSVYEKIDNLNLSTYNNLTQLNNDLIIIQNSINDIQQDLNNISLEVNELPGIQNELDQTNNDLNELNNSLAQLQDSMAIGFNDTALKNRIKALESENADLRIEINDLISTIDDLKEHDDDENKDEDGAEDVSTLAYGGLGLGILGVVIALVAIGMLLKKKKPPKEPPEAQEQTAQQISTEQPQMVETTIQPPEPQPQIPIPPQEQLPQIQQQPPPVEEQQ
jgi:uncharacterized coiled-coil DUF342 family protein